MKTVNAVKYFAGTALAVAISSAAVAEPTRGFSIEHGTIAEKGAVSVDLNNNLNGTSAGVRAGFGKFEFVLNSGHVGGNQGPSFDADDLGGFLDPDDIDDLGDFGDMQGTDAIVKVALPSLEGLSELKHSWAVFGGLSMYDDEVSKYTNISAGLAFTAEIDALSFTVTPTLVIDDTIDKTYLNIGMGAYFDLGETAYGSFKPGAEVIISTLSDADTVLNLGVRWGLNERVNLDLVPLQFGGQDVLSLPGQIRLNAAF